MPLGLLPLVTAAGAAAKGGGLIKAIGSILGPAISGGLTSGLSKRVDAWAAGDRGNYFGTPAGGLTNVNIGAQR